MRFLLSGGHCVRGDLTKPSDFVCLCPRCLHGKICQFSNELLSFTLDSLITDDIRYGQKSLSAIYVLIVALIFIIGFFNNLCSFLTFIRPKPRQFGVGYYLLLVSILSQCSLLSLLLKIIYIVLYSDRVFLNHDGLNLYSCKIISFLLSATTRINYWLTSLVTIERLCIVLFFTFTKLKRPKVALSLSVLVIISISGMHIHELFYYTTVLDPTYTAANVTICVTEYTGSVISVHNRVNVLVHHAVPFIVQFLSVTILIIQTARHRARTFAANKENTFMAILKMKFRMNKEHYYTPSIIILSSLPQVIFSFTYACTELKAGWQRYTLLATYLLSYLPQVLGFLLYVLPSTQYKEEFQKSFFGKRLMNKN